MFGRKASFAYAPKLWSQETSASPREYADPHKAAPDNTPNGFQDCYETQYLQGITVSHVDGSALFSIAFAYDPSPDSPGAEAVANVAPDASGDTCKRLLTGFALANADGQSLPGYRFDYYQEVSQTDTNLGALKSITWPTGGCATYAYQAADLSICQRSITLTPPSPMPANSTPRVWFGSDYAVVLWYNTGSQQLSMQIQSWNGQWTNWQSDPNKPLLVDGAGISLSTVTVLAGEGFVAVTYNTSKNVNLHLFQKVPSRPGQWAAAALPSGGSGGCNAPTWYWPLSSGQVAVMAGREFVLATQMNTSQNKGVYDLFTWNWPSQQWSHAHSATASYAWFAVGREYYAMVDMSSKVTLSYLSPTGEWKSGGVIESLGFKLTDFTHLALTSDLSTLAISHLLGSVTGTWNYDLYLLQWNADYVFAPFTKSKFSFSDQYDKNYPTSWAPTIIGNSMVAVSGNLLRFNGQKWLSNAHLKPRSGVQSGEQRYAYGPDYGVMILQPSVGSPTAQLVGYDATSAGDAWSSEATAIKGLSLPTSHQNTANFAAANNPDFLVVGTQLFFRGTATNWAKSVGSNIADLQALIKNQVNSASVLNEAPGFVACAVYDAGSPTGQSASVLVLRNGGVYGQAQMVGDQRMWTSEETGDAPGESGKFPGGEQVFFSYPDTASSLDAARSVSLHRYAGDAIKGPIKDWPVTAITIDDGLSESFSTRYAQDQATAACDASGSVVKYYRSTVYPGGDAANPVNGWVESCYLNGNEIVTGNFYNALDGLLHSVTIYDVQGTQLASMTNNWTPYVTRAGDPSDPQAAQRQLYGAYVLQTGKVSKSWGVESTQKINYIPAGLACPYTGQPATKTTTTMNGGGQLETVVTTYAYACEVNESSRIVNDVKSTASQGATRNGITTSMAVTALAPWPTCWQDVLTPAEEADFGWTGGAADFPFATYQPGDVPDGFQCTTRIERRDANGAVLQQADGSGAQIAYLYAATLGLPVATFRGAALAECAWCNFQIYEDPSAIHVVGGSACADNAWLGVQSLRLPPGASVSPKVEAIAGKPYLLGYRYQTPSGYQGNGSPWFTDTQGQWRYVTAPISALGGPKPAVDELCLANQGSVDILLDSVLLIPFGADVTLQSWHPQTRLLRAGMAASGATNFTLYDNFNQCLGAVGADGRLQELNQRFLSRQGSAKDSFSDASPNAEITLQMAEGGVAETFLDDSQWASRWRPGDSALWSTTNGAFLVKSSANEDTLSWQGATNAPCSAAFFMEITPQDPLAGDVSIRFGAGESVGWSKNGGWYWQNAAGASIQPPLAKPPRMATQWLLVLTSNHALFFGNGQLLFSHASNATPAQGLVFSTGPNSITITNLIVGAAPRMGVSYNDGAARQRQVHQLCADDSRVMEIVYDALDRQIASTRIAPGSFGQGASAPLLQYRSSFLNVGAFLAALQNTCAMQGDIADYYQGQQEGAAIRSDDQGYPYVGLRYQAAAQKLVVESGKPGKQLSIHDVDATTPAQRQTTRTTYTASGEGDPVPAGQFLAQHILTPAGYQGRQWIDTAKRAVAMLQMDATGNNVGQTKVVPSYSAEAGSAGATGTFQLPNFSAPGPQSNPQAFVRSILQNPLGLVASYADPDSGATSFVYNGKGQARFVQVPLEAGESYFRYTRYDALGRILEEGIVNADWNAETLAAKADDLDYPSAKDGALVSRFYRYDGDGTDPNSLGRMIEVVTYNPAPAANPALGDCTVTESFSYDSLGRAISATLEVRGAASLVATVGYRYNTLNEIVQIDLPEGSPLAAITYRYDDQGRILAIGVPDDPAAIASYTWSADGQLTTATRGALSEVWNYDSPGNILNHQITVGATNLFSQSYAYTPDSQIASRNTCNGGQSRSVAYSYDGQQRLSAAKVADGKSGNQAITQYDANGNIYSGTQDGHAFSAAFAAGTDRLDSAVLADGRTVQFHYRADGNADQWRGMAIEYDAALGTTKTVTQSGASVRYARGYNNSRVLRQQGDSLRISLQGAGKNPLIIWDGAVVRLCIWGPDGLAALHDGALQYPITDHQQTVWSVADPKGNVLASYDYLPFGGINAQHDGTASGWLFQYCGKEWDAATGLYDFGARLYDPALLRYVSADPARQYASPYVFSSNNPLNVMDPTGDISIWAQVGIGVAMAAVAIGGLALTLFTGGGSDVAAAGIEAGLAGAAGATEATAEVAAVGAEAAVGASVEAAVEGGAEVSAGVARTVKTALTTAADMTKSAAKKVFTISRATSVAGSAMFGAGEKGLSYDVLHGRDFTAKGFFEAVGVGALSGAIYGGMGSLGSDFKFKSVSRQWACRTLFKGIGGVVSSDVSTMLTDVTTGKPVTGGQLLLSSATGFISSSVTGGLGALQATSPTATAVCVTDRIIVKASTLINKTIDFAESAAQTQAAYATYIAGGFFLTSGYLVWGVAQSQNQKSS